MELLRCALYDHLPQEAFISLPGGRMSHACYMDDTAVTLSSLSYLPQLKDALNTYCAGTNALFNESKTELLLINHETYTPSPEFPLTPVPDGKPIRYLGAYLGNNINHDELTSAIIAKITTHAARACRRQTTLRGRTLAMATFSIPKVTYHFNFLPFSAAAVNAAARVLYKLAWGRPRPYLNHNLLTLPVRKGGFSFPNLRAIHRATLL
ncbi:hypothetical protein GQ54DRAFT_267507, partial [Martensiomyces pterosporus]